MKIDYTTRKCFAPKLSKLERKTLVSLIKIVDSILTLNNIDWIPIGGNGLSVLRYNKLILPWDDDFDMVIRKNQRTRALRLLKQELPKYNCEIKYWNNWKKTDSVLYKIYYKDGEGVIPFTKNNKTCTFPFIDLFIYNKKNHPNRKDNIVDYTNTHYSTKSLSREAVDLDILEYPLIQYKCEGVNIKVPSRGFRSFQEKKKSKILDICYDNPFCHKIRKNIQCKGINIIECNQLHIK